MNQLKTKIDEVKAKLGLTQMQLSERIGKNPYYLDTVKHRGVTTERQNELMLELEFVANGGEVITERSIVTALTEKAESLQEKLNKAQAANKELCSKLELAEVQHRHLEEMYDHNWDKLQSAQSRVSLLSDYKEKYYYMIAACIVISLLAITGFALLNQV